MNALKKTILGAAMALALAGGAQASVINVGGVVWDPDATWTVSTPFGSIPGSDFAGTSATMVQTINPMSGALSGYGVVTFLNNTAQSAFCPGCELTITFSGYTPISVGAVPGIGGGGSQIQYTGGSVQIWVDRTPETNGGLNMTAVNTGDGDLWASFVAHPNREGITLTGTNYFPTLLQGGGLLDVIGGLAFSNLDTNTQTGGADMAFSTTFTQFAGSPLTAAGAGTFNGNSIPEPASLALAGLGLVGLGALRRRREAK